MRIAFLTPEFVTEPLFYGGLANYLDRVTRALAARGHEPEVFVPAEREESFPFGSIAVHRVHVPTSRTTSICHEGQPRAGDVSLPTVQRVLRTAHALETAYRRRAAEVEFDIIQASNYLAVGLFVARQGQVPVVTRVSSYAPLWAEARHEHLTPDQRLAGRLEAAAIRLGDACYSPSRLLAGVLKERERIRAEVLEPPFIPYEHEPDLSRLGELSSMPRYLLFFGHMHRMKGAQALREALPLLLDNYPDFCVVLAGSDIDECGRGLLSLEDAYPRRVRYLGVLTPAQLQPIVQRASVVALPSLMDNLPNSCLESMAAGRVVIGTSGASFEQLIEDGVSGLLVPAGDSVALRIAIERAWQMDDAKRWRMGEAARQRIAQLGPEVTIPKLESFYERVIVEKPRGMRRVRAKAKRLEARLAWMTCALTEASRVLIERADELAIRGDELVRYQGELARYERERARYQGELARCQDQLAGCQGELARCQDQLVGYQDELARCLDELMKREEEMRQVRSRLELESAAARDNARRVQELEVECTAAHGLIRRIEQGRVMRLMNAFHRILGR